MTVQPRDTVDLSIGSTTVELERWWSDVPRGARRQQLIHLHANEATAKNAALQLLQRRPIELCSLAHSANRRIRCVIDEQVLSFDPNRCFSDAGIALDLESHGQPRTPAIVAAIADFRRRLVATLWSEQPEVVIALHNNSDGAFSVTMHRESRAATKCFHAEGTNPHDFFYVTEQAHFETLRQMQWNVVLESPTIDDDGSLSIYCAQRAIPYINIESQAARLGDEWCNMVMILDALHLLDQLEEKD